MKHGGDIMKIKYPKIIHFGEEITEFFKDGTMHIEEKIDGSQFRIWLGEGGVIQCVSKSVDWNDEIQIDKMFLKAVGSAKAHFTGHGYNYCMVFCEYLQKPRHNTLAYERVPKDNIMVLDICIGGKLLDYGNKKTFCDLWGLECIPKLWDGDGKTLTQEIVHTLLDNVSILGGEKIEGVVFKNYDKIWQDGYQAGKLIMLKFVKEEFKERNHETWRGNTKRGFLDMLTSSLATEARWRKAVEHLREQSLLANTPTDIGILMQEINRDVLEEETENIKEALWKFFGKDIRKGITKGFPTWYKERLLNNAIPSAS